MLLYTPDKLFYSASHGEGEASIGTGSDRLHSNLTIWSKHINKKTTTKSRCLSARSRCRSEIHSTRCSSAFAATPLVRTHSVSWHCSVSRHSLALFALNDCVDVFAAKALKLTCHSAAHTLFGAHTPSKHP